MLKISNKTKIMFLFVIVALVYVTGSVAGDDLPCAARAGDSGQGYICVCNSTYCDTVGRPERLDQGLYYMYSTSNTNPGFTRTTGGFIDGKTPKGNSTSDVVFIVNASTTYQEIIGIGASVTDSSCANIMNLPGDAQYKLIESYFGPTGIEYSMLRIPIGGTDFSTRVYTLDDDPFDENLDSFSLAPEDLKQRIPLIKKAMSMSQRDIKLLACTWAAPAWMKNSNKTQPDYIKEKYLDVWARYHLKFLEEYHKQGLKVWSLSGGNEGMLMIFLMALETPSINSTLQYASNQRLWLKSYLKPYLASSNFSDVKFLTLEDQRMFAPYWMERIASDAEAYEAVDGIALHWYSDSFIPASILDDLHNKYPDKLILYTETSVNGGFGSDTIVLGSWYRASGYLYNIFENIERWSNAYLDWNMALDLDGGPSLSFGIDGPIIVNKTSGEFYKQPIFYAMGHLSKFILPGAVRVQVISNQNDTKVKTNGQDSGKSKKDALGEFLSSAKIRSSTKVSLPDEPTIFNVTIPPVVQCLALSNPDDSFTVLVLNTKNETARVRIEDSRVGHISLSVEENSINTIVYWP